MISMYVHKLHQGLSVDRPMTNGNIFENAAGGLAKAGENTLGSIGDALETISKPFVQIIKDPVKALTNTGKSITDFAADPVKATEDFLDHTGSLMKDDPMIAKIAAVVANVLAPGAGAVLSSAQAAAISAAATAAQSRAEGKPFDQSLINGGIAAALSYGTQEGIQLLKQYGATREEMVQTAIQSGKTDAAQTANLEKLGFDAADAKTLSKDIMHTTSSSTIKETLAKMGSVVDEVFSNLSNSGYELLKDAGTVVNKITGNTTILPTELSDQLYGAGNTLESAIKSNMASGTSDLAGLGSVYGADGQQTLNDSVYNSIAANVAGKGFSSPANNSSVLDEVVTGTNATGTKFGTDVLDLSKEIANNQATGTASLAGVGSMYGAGSSATLANTVSAATNPLTTAGAALTGAGSAGLANALGTATQAAGTGLAGASLFDTLGNVKTLGNIADIWNTYNTADANKQTAQDVLKYSNPYYNYQQQYEIPLKIAQGQFATEQQAKAGTTLDAALASAKDDSLQTQFDKQLATTQGYNDKYNQQLATAQGYDSQYQSQLGRVNTLADQLAQERTQVNPMIGQFNTAATGQLGQNDYYNQLLKQSYTDPVSVYQSPEMQALSNLFLGQLSRKDAAAGRNSQYGARAVDAQNNFLSNLNQYRGTLNTNLGTGATAATGYGNTAVGYQNAATQQLNAGNSLLGNYNTTLNSITGQQQANTALANSITGQYNANNATLGNITGQQNSNIAGTNSLNSIYGNQNTAINNALNFANATGQKADTSTYGNLNTAANMGTGTAIAKGINVLSPFITEASKNIGDTISNGVSNVSSSLSGAGNDLLSLWS